MVKKNLLLKIVLSRYSFLFPLGLFFIIGVLYAETYGDSRGSAESEPEKIQVSRMIDAGRGQGLPMRFISAMDGKGIAGATIELPEKGTFTTNNLGVIYAPNMQDGRYILGFAKRGFGKNSFTYTVSKGTVRFDRGDNRFPEWITVPPFFDKDPPRGHVSLEYSYFSPNNDGVLETVTIFQDGTDEEYWKGVIETADLSDTSPKVVKTFKFTGKPPPRLSWDGIGDDGNLCADGDYRYYLHSIDEAENEGFSNEVRFSLRSDEKPIVEGSLVSFKTQSEHFSPDGDGIDDELIMKIESSGDIRVVSWSLEIKEPQAPFLPFHRIDGRGPLPATLVWNGRSAKGELVQSGMDYPFVLTARDAEGKINTVEGNIGVDILIIRNGEQLYIQVPSIIFRANEADYLGLPVETVSNNRRVLERIAAIFNKFGDYKVLVEGHANPTQMEAKTRKLEETLELQPLSEKRAQFIVDRLVELGVVRNRLSSTGMGGKRPLVAIDDYQNWWKNRRVEFVLIKK
ncbi:OmpA family protein [Breznakiellaceae bacterium SP9]